jgi:hypothetical protein
MVPEGGHDLVVVVGSEGCICLVLLERGQEGSKVNAGYGNHMWWELQCHQRSLAVEGSSALAECEERTNASYLSMVRRHANLVNFFDAGSCRFQ